MMKQFLTALDSIVVKQCKSIDELTLAELSKLVALYIQESQLNIAWNFIVKPNDNINLPYLLAQEILSNGNRNEGIYREYQVVTKLKNSAITYGIPLIQLAINNLKIALH